MLNRRLELDAILRSILGTKNVYFQAPASLKMKYPAIRYSRSDIANDYADDEVYHQTHEYELIVIDEDPDSEIVEKVSQLKRCKYNRHYAQDGLNHDVFTIIY